MAAIKNFGAFLLLLLVVSGCAHSDVTNLTPSVQPRNASGLYPLEFAWDSNMQALRDDSLTPYVVVGFDAYEMRPTLGMNNRWEAFVPVATNLTSVTYHFKVDYNYNRIGAAPGKGSKLSRSYLLRILD